MRAAPIVSVSAALTAFAVLMAVALGRAGWAFEYPLDDVYIHLAMAEQIAAGGYGVNAGEIASAASSPLYPLLLLPLPGTEVQRMLPLIWNLVGLIAAAWLWARVLIAGGLFEPGRAPIGWAAAVLGPVMVNSFGLAFTGMEHTLHMAATLAVVLGLVRLVREDRLVPMLFIGLVLSTALRLEGAALGLLTAAVVWRLRGFAPALVCAGLTLVPILAFTGTLMALGLDPLPESVQAKLSGDDTQDMGRLQRVVETYQLNISMFEEFPKPAGQVLFYGALLLMGMIVLLPRLREPGPQSLAVALFLAVNAHLMFGQIGWMDRYEGYIWAALAAGLIVLSAYGPPLLPALALVAVTAGGLHAYRVSWFEHFPWNIRAIHLQPAQSARFAQDFARVPAAVNDLGRVAWGNPDYVLDLWGLASAEARYWRIVNPVPGWADPLAEKHGVRLAMIYEKWLADATGPDWVKLGELHIVPGEGYLGDSKVGYFATDPAFVDELRGALADWVPTLPEGAVWVPAGD